MKTLFRVFSLFVFTAYFSGTYAQLSEGGTPYSFRFNTKSAAKEIEFINLPAVNHKALLEEDSRISEISRKPFRYGKDVYVNHSPENSGTWKILDNGDRLWRLGIRSEGALSLGLTFDKYRLPKGASLYIYNVSRTEILGAFTSRNNQEDGYFASSLIFDHEVIIEYYEPAGVSFSADLHLWRVTHGYRDLIKHYKSFGASGSCNVNAACPEGNEIRDQIRSVALILIGGNACTGTLINNTTKDGTPYLLSADHCFGTPGALVFWFNWQSKDCINPSTSPAYDALSGAVSRARYIDTDFWLLELNDAPPDSFEIFYSGWNRTTTDILSGMVYGIHHPNADIKKISWSDGGVQKDYLYSDPEEVGGENDYWRVNSWSDGTTTEKGSSGSALFDKNKRIIGQLTAGNAACGNTASDWYGRIGESWLGGGTSDSRLSNWLDPLGLGVTTLNGLEPSLGSHPVDGRLLSIVEPFDSYLDSVPITPKLIIQNYGSDSLTEALIECTINSDTTLKSNWSGNLHTGFTDTVVFGSVRLPFDKHSFSSEIFIDGDADQSNNTLSKNFTIVDCGGNTLPISQGFNNPNAFICWNKTILNGDGIELSIVDTGSMPKCPPTEGTHLLEFNSWLIKPGSIRLSSQSFSTIEMDSIMVSFDWYHDQGYPTYEDKLIIQYSFDEKNWINVTEILRYNDSITGWERKNVLLPDITANNSELYVGLQFISDWGNNCHLDSLVLSGTIITEPFPDFKATPVIGYVDSLIKFSDMSLNGPFTSWQWDFGDGAFPASAEGKGPHEVSYATTGRRTISLVVDDTLSRIKENYLTINEGFFPPRNLSASLREENNVYLLWDPKVLFEDGFESGDFSKWDTLIKGGGTPGEIGKIAYWHVGDEYSLDGNYGAITNWGYTINTRIVTPPFLLDNDQIIRFNWLSSYYYNILENNGDLIVEISSDGGSNWAAIWRFSELDIWEEWEWYETAIDLSIYEGIQMQFAFHIIADDNADIAIDNVYLGDGSIKSSFGTKKITEYNAKPGYMKSAALNSKSLLRTEADRKAAILSTYTVYRDNVEIAQTPFNFFTDYGRPIGIYEYYVTTTYTNPDGVSIPSNKVSVEVFVDDIGQSNQDELNIFPNPGNGLFQIELDRPYLLKISNVEGQLIRQIHVEPGTETLDLRNNKSGVYIMLFVSDDTSLTKKLVIE